MSIFKKYDVQFFTATILAWKKLLRPSKYKDIVIESLKFLVANKRVSVQGFVIMDNHIHIIWSIKHPHLKEDIQRDFLKFTAQQIKFDLIKNHGAVLAQFEVNARGRKYQFWQRNSLSIDIWTGSVLKQKLNYIHENPVKAGLVNIATDYVYSSARFYSFGVDDWGFLTSFDE